MNHLSRMAALTAILMHCAASNAQPPEKIDEPYFLLREAYGAHSAEKAAQAYAEDAIYSELYDGTQPRLLAGRVEISRTFKKTFQQFATGGKAPQLDLNFRLVARHATPEGSADVGLYRLQVGEGQTQTSIYGRFSAQVQAGLFRFDTSTNATADDFESAPNAMLFNSENETLLPSYYDALLGEYAAEDGCTQIITRSTVRLFARDTCTDQWRGLYRVSGHVWTSGGKVIDPKVNARYQFAEKGQPPELKRIIGEQSTTYALKTPYRQEAVKFKSADGVQLAGTLYLPSGSSSRRPAVVLVHGSGPQDRHGYASIIGFLADAFARDGLVVLVYDKRGVGESGGSWASASFETLANDAMAGMKLLKDRPEVNPALVGLAGSSQAGWIVAKAIEAGAKPQFTVLIGAAGSALTVEEQNLYNTEARMRCAKLPADQMKLALEQQNLFYAARRDPTQAQSLKDATRALSGEIQLQDWLFPATVDRDARNEWFNVLELEFDPIPVWAAYDGQAYFVFGEMDDSTPTTMAVQRLKDLPNPSKRQVVELKGAQHLGLEAIDLCHGELTDATKFHAALFPTLTRWTTEIRGN